MTSNKLLLLVQSSAAMINLTGVFYFKKELKKLQNMLWIQYSHLTGLLLCHCLTLMEKNAISY